MISSQIINQVWSSGVTTDDAANALTSSIRAYPPVTPSDFDMSNPRFAGGVANITGGDKGGKLGGYGGEEFGAEFEGRLFPYIGDIKWGTETGHNWCSRCEDYVMVGTIQIEGCDWTICKECLWVLDKTMAAGVPF